MAAELGTPQVDGLAEVLDAMRSWQHDGAPVPLHPGDLGWYWRFGAEATAAAVRTWTRDGHLLAVGLLDGPGLLRLGLAPEAEDDEDLARQLVADVADGSREVLPPGSAAIEVRSGDRLRTTLLEAGWDLGEPWTPLRRDLTDAVETVALRIEVSGPESAPVRADVHTAAFERSTFTPARWHTMAAGPAYADARCLVGYDGDVPVAAVTVWSAGPGRPGLLEPMGVHRDHRGRGHGRAITLAAASALRELGSSTAIVCTMSANVGGVAAYESAGFRRWPEVRDLVRGAV